MIGLWLFKVIRGGW